MSGEHSFTVRYFGTRGSIPTPGPSTVRYGGNTTCIEVRCGPRLIVIDAGSGLRCLGKQLCKAGGPVEATFLFSHAHWDHIQGFPFFTPYFTAGNRFDIWSEQRVSGSLLDVIRGQMAQPTFPITLEDLPASLAFHEVSLGGRFRIGDDVIVRTAPLNHPGGATAFRIEYAGRSFVHASDHEHTGAVYEKLLHLARGATCLSYDSTYTDDEYAGANGSAGHVGWGHSTWQEAVRMARTAGVGQLVFTHHDPEHGDALLDELEPAARKVFPASCFAAEGMAIDLLADPPRVTRPW